jgi:hypothetical protein
MRRVLVLLLVVPAGACTPTLEAEGPHHKYVISSIKMPAQAAEAAMFAVDLKGDGTKINAFGAALAGVVPIDKMTNIAIQHGTESLLLDLQTRSYDSTAAAGVAVRFGESPVPTPCTAPDSCGHHLMGTGKFQITFDSPGDAGMYGIIQSGTFISDNTPMSIQLSFDGMRAVKVPLLVGRVQLQMMSDGRIGAGVIGGAIARDLIMNSLLAEIETGLDAPLRNDCTFTAPGCACTPSSPGQQIQLAFDKDANCIVDQAEFMAQPGIVALTRSDLMVSGIAAVSFGMGVVATSASF